jgi:hypothetical protein
MLEPCKHLLLFSASIMNEKSNIHIPMYAKIMILTPAPPVMEASRLLNSEQ